MPMTVGIPALRRLAVFLWPVLWLGASEPALAAEPSPTATSTAATEQVQARLLAGVTHVQPGQPLVLGVQQRIIPHWHTYWRNPGDSGLATQIEWALPAGASAGPIEWPAPSRFKLGPVFNYGYADEVMLLSTLQVPATLNPGESFKAQATVDWLVCEETCIPQQVVLALSLPVQTQAPQPGPDAALIRAAQARLPQPAVSPAQWRREGQGRQLQLQLPASLQAGLAAADLDEAYFYAAQWGQVNHGEAQRLSQSQGQWHLHLVAGEAAPAADASLDGVLVLRNKGGAAQAYALQATPDPAGPLPAPAAAVAQAGSATDIAAQEAPPSLWAALALAFAGGLILNLMPCVFPVLSIKALSLLSYSEQSRGAVRAQGLAYTAGVLVSFLLLAGVLIALKAGGAGVGWGFQFQSPVFVLGMAWLMVAVGLNLSGVYTLGSSLTGVGSGLAQREGYAGSFYTGVLATVVATPCTAPFMGAALGYAVTQAAPITLAVFASLGLSYWPALQRWLPRPGAWMERLKQALAFPMYAAAAWLVWVLSLQAGPDAVAVALGGLVLLGLAAWLLGSTQMGPLRTQRTGVILAGLALLGALAVTWAYLPTATPAGTSTAVKDGAWEPYSPERLQALRAEGKPVFVNLTAAWCITCLVNERVALSQASVQAAFKQGGITRLKGDWTQRDDRITRLLAEHGRDGVPLYLYFPAGVGQAAQVLPQLLTPDLVIATLTASR
jgi:thiol:disulfide interchange protein